MRQRETKDPRPASPAPPPRAPESAQESASGHGPGFVTVERMSAGETLVFLARTRNAAEVAELDEFFNDLRAGCHVRLLARGPLVAAAVRLFEDPTGEAAPELMRLLESVGERYRFSRAHLGLHPTVNRLIEDMALDTGAEVFPAPVCSLCHRPEPFPTRVTLEMPRRSPMTGAYCHSCVTRYETSGQQDWILALMHEDQRTFAEGVELELKSAESRRGNRVSYAARALRKAPSRIVGGG